MIRLFFFLLGFGFSLIGFINIITYLNYLSIGYTFYDYLKLIIFSPECLIAFIGIFIISAVILTKGDKYDIRI